MDENQQAPEVELQVAMVAKDIPVTTARLSYQLMMPGLVSRLYLYLFGQLHRTTVAYVSEKVLERRTVMDQILTKQKVPLRALYDYLIAEGIIEDQKLSADAMAYIDQADPLQLRIVDQEETPDVQPMRTYQYASAEEMMAKIKLNGDIRPTHCRYTLLLAPDQGKAGAG